MITGGRFNIGLESAEKKQVARMNHSLSNDVFEEFLVRRFDA
jgi:hypothetical protein